MSSVSFPRAARFAPVNRHAPLRSVVPAHAVSRCVAPPAIRRKSFHPAPVTRRKCAASTGTSHPYGRFNSIKVQANSFTSENHKTEKPLRITFVSAEVGPWSKTGGLGDVCGGLPIALAQRGHQVMTIAPRYDQYADAWDTSITRTIDGQEVRYFHTQKNGVDRVWVDNDAFLAKVWGKTGGKLYGQKSGADFSDNQKRFVLFNKAAVEALTALPFSPGEDCVVVAHDWHTAMFPVLLKDEYQAKGLLQKTKVAFCTHNIAYQGRFWEEQFDSLRVPAASKPKFQFVDGNPRVYDETEPADKPIIAEKGRKFKKVNWMKAAFLSADKLLTVSPTYAEEVATNESLGVELDGVIRQAGGMEGIVNGMDTTDWSPNVDKFLDVKYDADTVDEGKALAKEALQAELGLPVDPTVPLFGYIGRLEEQKGVDILCAALPTALQGANIQVAILGTGKKEMERDIVALEEQFPDSARGIAEFSTPLAHQIIAGSDFLLIPSRFEPCGLVQLHAMQYGTVPLVASTGGLVDTVKDGITGFHLGKMDTDKLLPEDAQAVARGMLRAAAVFPTQSFSDMRHKAIDQDLSWLKPARKWEAVLEALATGSTQAQERAAGVLTPVQTPEHVARSEKSEALREEAKAAVRAPRQPENVDTSPTAPKAAATAPASAATKTSPSAATRTPARAPSSASPRTSSAPAAARAPAMSPSAAAAKGLAGSPASAVPRPGVKSPPKVAEGGVPTTPSTLVPKSRAGAMPPPGPSSASGAKDQSRLEYPDQASARPSDEYVARQNGWPWPPREGLPRVPPPGWSEEHPKWEIPTDSKPMYTKPDGIPTVPTGMASIRNKSNGGGSSQAPSSSGSGSDSAPKAVPNASAQGEAKPAAAAAPKAAPTQPRPPSRSSKSQK